MQKSELNILVVEDDATLREALEKAIAKEGYRCIAVKKPEEAESFARIKPIHAALVDCMLPGKSGVDLCIRLREHMKEEVPVFLMSGIYRDKAFHQEAIKKVNGKKFFSKPLDLKVFLDNLNEELSSLLDAPKMDLHALLAAPMASQRERRKALDHVEEMVGYDLPFVFCILLEAESSGHLNIVDEKQNIYGVTFAKGCIQKVDSESTTMLTRQTLIKHGFITEEEISQVKDRNAMELMSNLVNQGLLSPHVPSIIKNEQIILEITKLIGPGKINVNFVNDRKLKPDADSLSFNEFKEKLFLLVDTNIPTSYLKSFYSGWKGHPISSGPSFQEEQRIFEHPLLVELKGLSKEFKKEPTLEELFANSQYNEEALYKALHILAVRRIITFSETKRVFDLDSHVTRLKSLHRDLEGKDVFEIFMYLGLGDNPKPQQVQKVYREFAKSHHPDTLPQAVSDEVKKLNHEIFSWVTEAHNILTDEKKKEKYVKGVRQEEAEKQLMSEDLLHEAGKLIQRSKFEEAKGHIDKAIGLYKSDKSMLYSIWIKLKMDSSKLDYDTAARWLNDIKKMPTHSKRTPLYYFVSGLAKKHMGNMPEAKNDFEKALQADPEFMDARRELATIKGGSGEKMTMDELLKADLGTVITKLFKKKGA